MKLGAIGGFSQVSFRRSDCVGGRGDDNCRVMGWADGSQRNVGQRKMSISQNPFEPRTPALLKGHQLMSSCGMSPRRAMHMKMTRMAKPNATGGDMRKWNEDQSRESSSSDRRSRRLLKIDSLEASA